MPVIVSTNFTISRAECTRVPRNARCDVTWNHRVSTTRIGSDAATTSALSGSKMSSAPAMNTMYSTPRMSPWMPESSSSRIESRSFVWRAMMRPEV